MSKGSRKRRHVPPSVAARSQQKQAQTASSHLWWWVGGVVVAALLIAVALWFTVGPGKPASPTPTAAFEVTSTPAGAGEAAPAATPAPTESTSGEESISMPANPADRNNMYSAPPAVQIDPTKTYVATISTAKGDIVVQLDASAAPQTVNNFVFLSRQGFYDGLTFHRVVPGFVIQGGDPLGAGAGGPGYKVPAEIGLPHGDGAIAMARQSDEVNPERASSGSQFYITLAPTPDLDGAYTVFGQVVQGRDVVQSIAIGDVIESITITEQP